MRFISVMFIIASLIGTVSCENTSETPEIESVVYDVSVDGVEYEGFCLLTLRIVEGLTEFRFRSKPGVEVTSEDLGLESDNDMHVLELNPGKNELHKIILKFKGPVSDHSIEMPFLQFPYETGNTLISVSVSRNKFVWDIDFPAYSLDRGDMALVQEGVTDGEITQLDSSLLELRQSTSGNPVNPKYKIYLDRIHANEKIYVGGWVGKDHEYYLPQVIQVILLSLILLSVFYLLSRKLRFTGEVEESLIQREEPLLKEKEAEWVRRKTSYEGILNKLQGDEQRIYQEIFDSGGGVLQKNLPEKTGFSKAKVTRILDRLEGKGLIERRSYGVTNKVVLK